MTSGWMRACCALTILLTGCAAQDKPLTPDDITALPSTPANQRIAYGQAPEQFGDLRLPPGKGPFPVVVVIHGGCWGEYADASMLANLASTLTKRGVATWNLEYRRLQNPGGGWPGTFQDIAAGVDDLRAVARAYPLDLKRVVTIGHSSGGHLALWAAARRGLPASSPLYRADALPLRGVVSLGGVADLRSFVEYGRGPCGDRHIRLMGGLPADVPDRYAQGSPGELLPLGVPQRLIYGAKDKSVPHRLFVAYETAAKKKGDDVQVIILNNSAHFEMLSPQKESWPQVESAILTLLGPL